MSVSFNQTGNDCATLKVYYLGVGADAALHCFGATKGLNNSLMEGNRLVLGVIRVDANNNAIL